jgi:peptidoglycan/xylan/chitin deacetylase (PgdA/CDA1 family)
MRRTNFPRGFRSIEQNLADFHNHRSDVLVDIHLSDTVLHLGDVLRSHEFLETLNHALRWIPLHLSSPDSRLRHCYDVARHIRGIGFRTADAISMKLGVDKTAMVRVRADRGDEQVIKSVMTKLEKHGKGIILMHDFQRATAGVLPELLNQLKAGGYKVVHMVAKAPLQTLAQYDEMVLKENKLPTVSSRPTSSVVRTISEMPR